MKFIKVVFWLVSKTAVFGTENDQQNLSFPFPFKSTREKHMVVVSLSVGTANVNFGITLGMIVYIIGALRGQQFGSDLYFTAEQASWFGGIMYITYPVGSLMYGLIQDSMSRKTYMVGLNVFQFVSSLVMYRATSVAEMIIAQVVIGLSSGISRPPTYSYLEETQEPRLRGTLTAWDGVFLNLGVILATIVGASFDWRTMVLYFSATPVISFLAILVIPESPSWLVLKGRIPEAERSFQWLRGWVPASHVQEELNALVKYVNSKTVSRSNTELKDSTIVEQKAQESAWCLLLHPSVSRPMRLLLLYQICAACVGLMGPKTFFKEVAEQVNLPISSEQALIYLRVLPVVGAVVSTLTLGRLGKRRLTFISLTLTITSCLGLGLHVLLNCPWSWSSLLFFGLSYFGAQLAMFSVPRTLISEIFPLRARSVATGVAAGSSYVIIFVVVKTFYTVMAALGLAGSFLLYGTVGLVGSVYLYWSLPETEGLTLEQIELFFVPDKTGEDPAKN